MRDDLISRAEAIDTIRSMTISLGGKEIFHPEAKKTVLDVIDSLCPVDAEPVRRGRCALCNIKETGHGIVAFYKVGWEVCINKRGTNYLLMVNHEGDQIEIPIDYCFCCGIKLVEEGDHK